MSPCGARYPQGRLKRKKKGEKKRKRKIHHFIKYALKWKNTEVKVKPALKIRESLE